MKGRRTGLGITAEGDMLAALGIRYGTDEATKFSEKIHKILALEAYKSSVEMAKERGAFEIYDPKREKENPFIKRIKGSDPELYEKMIKYGRRNIALLTIAPTGTVSQMTQTSSGIEPVFDVMYKRRRRVEKKDEDVEKVSVDSEGESWEHHIVFHSKFKEWLKIKGYDVNKVKELEIEDLNKIIKKSPYYKATSKDVNWLKKVELQGAVQKWVDHSISVTINLPKDVDEKLVSDLYMKAWEVGCKGLTIYREGSRKGILESLTKEDGSNKLFPKERPKSLEAEVLRFKNGNEDWIALIGLMHKKPYEIFTGRVMEDILNVPKNITSGWIVKVKENEDELDPEKHYDFRFKDSLGSANSVGGISRRFDKEYWNYARFVSSLLRNEIPIEEVISIISKLEDLEGINSWKNGTIRALKRYVPDGTKAEGEKCPECGEKLVYTGGCKSCQSCGFSACD